MCEKKVATKTSREDENTEEDPIEKVAREIEEVKEFVDSLYRV